MSIGGVRLSEVHIPIAETFAHDGQTQKLRILGSAALDICQVAAGRADAFFESGIYLWDVAAAGLIVEQAGGHAEIMNTGPHYQLRIIASNGRLHAPLRRLVL